MDPGRPGRQRAPDCVRRQKRRELDARRSKCRIRLGGHLEQWCRLKEQLGFALHSQLAKFLLDRYSSQGCVLSPGPNTPEPSLLHADALQRLVALSHGHGQECGFVPDVKPPASGSPAQLVWECVAGHSFSWGVPTVADGQQPWGVTEEDSGRSSPPVPGRRRSLRRAGLAAETKVDESSPRKDGAEPEVAAWSPAGDGNQREEAGESSDAAPRGQTETETTGPDHESTPVLEEKPEQGGASQEEEEEEEDEDFVEEDDLAYTDDLRDENYHPSLDSDSELQRSQSQPKSRKKPVKEEQSLSEPSPIDSSPAEERGGRVRQEGRAVAQFQAPLSKNIPSTSVRVGLDAVPKGWARALPLGSDTQGVIHHLSGFSSNPRAFKKKKKNTTFYLELAGATTYLLLPLCALERRHQNAPPQTLAGAQKPPSSLLEERTCSQEVVPESEMECCKRRTRSCDEDVAQIGPKRIRKAAKREILLCDFEGCGKIFSNRQYLNHHKKYQHVHQKTFTCSEPSCGKSFNFKKHLKEHEKLHSDKRDYICEFCARSFRTSSNLIIHRRIHTGEKPLQCEICGFTCRQKASLNWHMKKHDADSFYQFSCDICGKKFEKRDNVTAHKSKSHPEAPSGPPQAVPSSPPSLLGTGMGHTEAPRAFAAEHVELPGGDGRGEEEKSEGQPPPIAALAE